MFQRRDQAAALGCGLAALLASLAGCDRAARAPDLPHAPASLSPRFYAPPGWAWAPLRLKDGTMLRYGVASPPVMPRGSVLLLPDRDEPAEVWFETVNDLLARGYTVWLLDGPGPGAEGLDPAEGALTRMIGAVIRPHGRPLVLVGQGLGATLALRALDEGQVAGATGALLASPDLDLASVSGPASPDQLETAADWAVRLHLGGLPLPDSAAVRLDAPPPAGLDPRRAGLASTWRRADPALRSGPLRLDWIRGYDQAVRRVGAATPAAGASIPVVVAAPAQDAAAARICRRRPDCTLWAVPTSAPHLAPDAMRTAWLDRIAALIAGPRP